ncbi:hypothetical protein CHS0354_006194 [Potamilus streckersoni]|uniref:Uncharacterized protein n=1 Tax=Potamilus streckersoni TaxID=2493646 RepID=A0AAE0SRX4_9BIVA|nr:hypothetical protein CHS0354_006194 [Potamilus streckersoni]
MIHGPKTIVYSGNGTSFEIYISRMEIANAEVEWRHHQAMLIVKDRIVAKFGNGEIVDEMKHYENKTNQGTLRNMADGGVMSCKIRVDVWTGRGYVLENMNDRLYWSYTSLYQDGSKMKLPEEYRTYEFFGAEAEPMLRLYLTLRFIQKLEVEDLAIPLVDGSNKRILRVMVLDSLHKIER